MGLVTSFGGLITARFLLGIAECGLFPGICYALTMWYKRREASFRISLFFSSATLSGAFGGILAYGIGHLNGKGGKGGWAWIFIIEGLLTFVVACFGPWLIHDFPEDARFLNEDERLFVQQRLREDQGNAGEAPFSWGHIWSAGRDWKVWLFALTYIGTAMPFYALALFSPTIIAALGRFSLPESQLLSTPPYFLAFFTTMGTAIYSDKIGRRAPFMIFWMSWTIMGYIIIISVNPKEHPATAYIGLFFAISGIAPCISTCITWCGNNLGPTYKRATGMGIMFTIGNSGGIVASEVYRTPNSPRFIPGHAISLSFAGMALITSSLLWILMHRENQRRDREYPLLPPPTEQEDDEKEDLDRNQKQMKAWGLDGMTEQEVVDLGDRHPAFRYIL